MFDHDYYQTSVGRTSFINKGKVESSWFLGYCKPTSTNHDGETSCCVACCCEGWAKKVAQEHTAKIWTDNSTGLPTSVYVVHVRGILHTSVSKGYCRDHLGGSCFGILSLEGIHKLSLRSVALTQYNPDFDSLLQAPCKWAINATKSMLVLEKFQEELLKYLGYAMNRCYVKGLMWMILES